ncbi:MAG: GNAT family N-acetyltransferase [Pyrinomonadaceae bacterium]
MLAAEATIRLATTADAPEISRVLIEAFMVIREHYTDEAFAAVTPTPETVSDRFAEGPIWVAELDSKIVGTVSTTTEPDGLYMRSMAVSPAAQKLGIGRVLLDALHEHATGTGIERIFLYTLPFQSGAKGMYEKHGYRWVRDTTADEWYGVPGFEMEKLLVEPGTMATR